MKYASEKELIQACQSGIRSGQEALYQKYKSKLFGICLRYTSDRAAAEDLLQESFIKIFSAIHSFDGKGSLEGWLKRITVNTALDDYRKRSRRLPPESVEEHEGEEGTFELPDESTVEILLELIAQLPAGCRTVFNLYEIEGYAHKEIAEMLGISEGSSRSQLAYAKTKLAQKIKILFPQTYAVVRG